MFDLFPDVESLMLDLPIDPHHRASVRPDERHAPVGAVVERARDALGRGLIAIGSSLVIDEPARRGTAGR